jgi:shikimate kinase
MKSSISLIGMAGAGKTSLGRLLSSRLNFNFIDSDQVIESLCGDSLQEILKKEGKNRFQEIEKNAVLSTKFNKTVLATGGSVILLSPAMDYIKKHSKIIYIQVPYKEISDRITNFSQRGFIKRSNQSIEEAYIERSALYHEHADHVVSNAGNIDDCMSQILTDVLKIRSDFNS